MKDILERDQNTFVKARTEKGLGWEETLRKGDSYSKYILGDTIFADSLAVLHAGYRLACNVISTITPERVTVRVDPRNNFATSTKEITISTQVLEEKEYSDFEKIDVLLGEAAHEALHIAHTDFDLLSFPSGKVGEIKHAICNIIEDERIEIKLNEDFPGYSRFLEKIKYYYFDKLYRKDIPDYSTMTASKKLFSLFFSLVRYPKNIRKDDLETFSEEVEKIVDTLTPYPMTNEGVKKAVEKIYDILKAHHIKASDTGNTPHAAMGEAGENKTKGEVGKSEKGKIQETPDLSAEIGDMAKAVNALLSSSVEKCSKKEIDISQIILQNPVESLLLEGVAEQGKSKSSYFIKAESNQGAYEQARAEIAPYASTLSTLLQLSHKDYNVTNKNLRSGYLDTGKLVDGYQGVETIYETYEQIKSKNIDIALLVDESGSMMGPKINEARKCAVLFKEALSKVRGINTFIYGHTADDLKEDSTDIYVYAEGSYRPRYALGSIQHRSSNRDGVAILETARRIRKFSSDPCVLFVISDGQPSATDYYGQMAISHTKDSVRQAEQLGFKVIQIAIEPHIPSERMFTHFVRLTQMATLVKDLGAVLKKAVREMRG